MEEFEQHQLEEILKHISENLDKKTDIFLFGGAVMVYNNLKPSTKDIDILFETKQDFDRFLKASLKAGFIRDNIPLGYSHFDMTTMLSNPKTKWRLDLFFQRVCKKFCFNLDVKKRSSLFTNIGKLNVYFISFEDIFLMKSLTQRKRDLDDMRTILGKGLDFKEITKEINNQKQHKHDVMERLLEFEEEYDIKLDLPNKLRKEHETHIQKINFKLLKKQAKDMLKTKSKKEVMEYFDLTEEEWGKLNL